MGVKLVQCVSLNVGVSRLVLLVFPLPHIVLLFCPHLVLEVGEFRPFVEWNVQRSILGG
jgi:hypothetical protein